MGYLLPLQICLPRHSLAEDIMKNSLWHEYRKLDEKAKKQRLEDRAQVILQPTEECTHKCKAHVQSATTTSYHPPVAGECPNGMCTNQLGASAEKSGPEETAGFGSLHDLVIRGVWSRGGRGPKARRCQGLLQQWHEGHCHSQALLHPHRQVERLNRPEMFFCGLQAAVGADSNCSNAELHIL